MCRLQSGVVSGHCPPAVGQRAKPERDQRVKRVVHWDGMDRRGPDLREGVMDLLLRGLCHCCYWYYDCQSRPRHPMGHRGDFLRRDERGREGSKGSLETRDSTRRWLRLTANKRTAPAGRGSPYAHLYVCNIDLEARLRPMSGGVVSRHVFVSRYGSILLPKSQISSASASARIFKSDKPRLKLGRAV